MSRGLGDVYKRQLRTLHGMQTHGFPNCFFMGFTQGAVTVSVPQTLNEQAVHITYMLSQLKEQDASTIEATPEGEQGWLDEMASKARLGARFRAECTPGYYNNEGQTGNPNQFFAGSYGGGPIRFFRILGDWRENGRLDGVAVQ